MSDIIRISDARLEELIAEEVPYIDITTHILGIGEALGAMEYYTRENCVLCCTEEVARMATMLNLTVEWFEPSGAKVEAGQSFYACTRFGCQFASAMESRPKYVRPLLGRGNQDAQNGRRCACGQSHVRGADDAKEYAG